MFWQHKEHQFLTNKNMFSKRVPTQLKANKDHSETQALVNTIAREKFSPRQQLGDCNQLTGKSSKFYSRVVGIYGVCS